MSRGHRSGIWEHGSEVVQLSLVYNQHGLINPTYGAAHFTYIAK
jgi:hypothetical protein